MKKILVPAAYAAIAAILVGTLWFLYSRTQGADFARESRIVSALRELEAIDAEWTVDSLQAKTGIQRKYGPGRSPAERIPLAVSRIAEALTAVDAADARTAFGQLRTVLEKKRAVTARFAEQNLALRESLQFVSDKGAEFLAELRELQQDAAISRRSRIAYCSCSGNFRI